MPTLPPLPPPEIMRRMEKTDSYWKKLEKKVEEKLEEVEGKPPVILYMGRYSVDEEVEVLPSSVNILASSPRYASRKRETEQMFESVCMFRGFKTKGVIAVTEEGTYKLIVGPEEEVEKPDRERETVRIESVEKIADKPVDVAALFIADLHAEFSLLYSPNARKREIDKYALVYRRWRFERAMEEKVKKEVEKMAGEVREIYPYLLPAELEVSEGQVKVKMVAERGSITVKELIDYFRKRAYVVVTPDGTYSAVATLPVEELEKPREERDIGKVEVELRKLSDRRLEVVRCYESAGREE